MSADGDWLITPLTEKVGYINRRQHPRYSEEESDTDFRPYFSICWKLSHKLIR